MIPWRFNVNSKSNNNNDYCDDNDNDYSYHYGNYYKYNDLSAPGTNAT